MQWPWFTVGEEGREEGYMVQGRGVAAVTSL